MPARPIRPPRDRAALVIVVLSLNTAVDRVLVVPSFSPGRVYRTQHMVAHAGGKGLNVARVLRALGEPVRVVGLLGGAHAAFIRERCQSLEIDQRWVNTEGETRTCVIVADPTSGEQTVINEPGPQIRTNEVDRLRIEIERSVDAGDLLCISGSAPPGVPDDFYGEIAQHIRASQVRVLADVAGATLRLVLDAHPWAVAPNYEESVAAFATRASPIEMAERLACQADIALLTLGREGVIVADGRSVQWLHPPPVETVNAVGSGDAFVAGFLSGAAHGLPTLEAARLGVACGASNAGQLEPGIGSGAEIAALAAVVTIEQAGED